MTSRLIKFKLLVAQSTVCHGSVVQLPACLCRTGAQARLGPLLKALTELRAAALQLVVGLGPTVPPQLSRMESVESVVLDTRSPPRPVKIAPLALTASMTAL